MMRNRRAFVRLVSLLPLVALALAVWYVFRSLEPELGWRATLTSPEALRGVLQPLGAWGPVAFVLFQVLQVVVAPIPANAIAFAGGALFGLWPGFLLSSTGLIIGSMIAFGLARVWGRPVVESLVQPELIDRYFDGVVNRHFIVLTAIFLVPFLPDDVLSFLVGLSSLPAPAFFVLVIVARPPGMFVSTLLGSGVIEIPWWGWVAIGVTSAALLFVAHRYRDAIDRRLGLTEKT
ncbi:MAG: TVP38/TMEM64 family protein [Alkalispirochaeta sp.]